MNFVRSNNVSLKYQRFATLGSKDIGIINSEFVAKTQFLRKISNIYCNIRLLAKKCAKNNARNIIIIMLGRENEEIVARTRNCCGFLPSINNSQWHHTFI